MSAFALFIVLGEHLGEYLPDRPLDALVALSEAFTDFLDCPLIVVSSLEVLRGLFGHVLSSQDCLRAQGSEALASCVRWYFSFRSHFRCGVLLLLLADPTALSVATINIHSSAEHSMDSYPIETITFDSYTTLVNVGSQEEVLASYVDDLDDPESVSRFWRARNMMYTVIANDIDVYRPFYEILGLSLKFALESHGHDVSKEVRDEIRRTVYKDDLSIYEDVRSGMERLQELGYDMYIVSNGNPEMLDDLIKQAEVQDLIQDTISAHEVRKFKPPVEIYRHTAARTGTPIRDILHVSGGTMRDVWGAKHAGMQTAWVNRPSEFYPKEQLGKDPDMIVEGFDDLADQLACPTESLQ